VAEPARRVRAPGGGRKKLSDIDPELMAALKALVDPDTRGDPMSPLVWTTKSTRNLAAALTAAGHRVSDRTVARMLRALGFSLQANAKVLEGRQHEDRDGQFRYLNRCVGEHVAAGQPVISVDTKKKELVGEFANGGREYQPKGSPVPTNVHDFMDKELGKAIPYGVYDVTSNTGWVSVGTDHDTAAFAVATLRRWWRAGASGGLAGRTPGHPGRHGGDGGVLEAGLLRIGARMGGVAVQRASRQERARPQVGYVRC
jgi:hypothetical protein